jgi:hypothetical protein
MANVVKRIAPNMDEIIANAKKGRQTQNITLKLE